MSFEIVPVSTRAELREFIGLPSRVYKGLPGFVAPPNFERAGLLDPRKGSFFKHGEAQYWLARKDGASVGRISAQIDFTQPEGVYDGAGLFGCLDAVDDMEVTSALFATAEAWLRAKGKSRAAGPFLLSLNQEPGLLVAGHLEPPIVSISW
ncbi:MAG: hypothetical protein KKH72_02570, partial [Alphaproteobacteria bacterium]|nr:hypothetical protein [Alphaproteobacteria bacterium]